MENIGANNGGPAFPVNTSSHDGHLGHQTGNTTWQFPGMSLRDYFAAQALPGVVSSIMSAEGHGWCTSDFADEAYRLADAMLKVRAA